MSLQIGCIQDHTEKSEIKFGQISLDSEKKFM